MVSQVCPDQERLAGFVQGLLTHQESHELEDHLQRCNTCGDTVRELHASDTVLRYVRTLDIDDEPQEQDEPQIASLLEELRELPAKTAASVSEPSDRTDVDLRVDEVLRLASPPVADSETAGELGRIAHYRLLSLLGVGGMGVVFQAEDTKLQRLVALKVLQPSLGKSARDRFVREARAAAAIQHDNVITIYDVGLEGPLAYLAMQSLEGETLEQRLQREGSLPPEEIRRIGAEVADGLEAAHAKKLVHRDIKPANIWLEANRGRAQILDFGLARVSDADSELTETGMIAGTPAYMSPEQAQGRSVDTRTDLFSLGSMMYRMLTGHVPFEGGNALATIRAIQSDQPTDIRAAAPNVPEDMEQTIDKLMAKETKYRVASATELADALRNHRPAKIAQQEPAKQNPAQPATSGNFSRSTAAVAATILLAMAGWYAAPMIYRVVTNQGVFEIDTQDPNVQVEVMQSGEQIEILDSQKNRITIAAGKYELQLKDKSSHAIVTPETVTLSRNDVAVVRVKKVTPPGKEAGRQEESAEETLNIQTYTLKTRDPQGLADMLEESGALSPAATIRVDSETKTLLIVGSKADHSRVEELIKTIDSNVRRFYGIRLRKHPAAQVATMIERMMGQGEDDQKDTFGVTADVENNKLILKANDAEYAIVLDLLAQLGEVMTGQDAEKNQVATAPGEKARVPFDYGKLKPNPDLEKLHGISGLAAVLGESPSSIWGLPLRLALTPDESHVYLVSSNGYVVVHDTETLELVSRFRAHQQRCLDVVVVDEGRKLVTISTDGTARLWDVTGSEPRKLHQLLLVGPEAESKWLGMEVASNGLIVIRSAKNVHLVRIEDERFQQETLPRRGKKSPWEFALSPDGKWLVTSNENLLLWNLSGETPEVSDEYKGKDFMTNLMLDKKANGEYLIEAVDQTTFAATGEHKTWRIDKHGKLKLASHSSHCPTSFAKPQRNRRGNLLARPSLTAKELVIESDQEGSSNPVLQTGELTAITFIGDDSVLVATHTSLQRWNRAGDTYVVQQELDKLVHGGPVTGVFFDKCSDALISSSSDHTSAWLYPSQTASAAFPDELGLNKIHKLTQPMADFYLAIRNEDEQQLLTGVRRNKSGEMLKAFEIDFGGEEKDSIWSAVMHPTQDLLATGYWNGNIRLWDVHEDIPVPLVAWSAGGGHVCDLEFSPDGIDLVAGLHMGSVKSWDWERCVENPKGAVPAVLSKHDDYVRAVEFSPDGAYVASGGEDGKIILHRFEDGNQTVMSQEWSGDPLTVGSLQFSNDGKELLSADGAGRVTVWSIPDGKVLKTWQLPGWVWSARFSPDEKVVATGNGNGSVYVLRK